MMKLKAFFPRAFVIALIIFICCNTGYPQINIKRSLKTWTTNNPFKTDAFVENLGQFDNCVKTNEKVKYVINNQDKIFFTDNGFIIKLEKKNRKKTLDKKERENEPKSDTASYIYKVKMNWQNCNTNLIIKALDQSEGYYTFGEKGYEKIKAKAYKRLLYKNLYNGIDIEYSIPENGGVKYRLIVNPGGDLSKVMLTYTGDIEEVRKETNGNIVVKTEAGEISDHSPEAYYEGSLIKVKTEFLIKGISVQFNFPEGYDKSKRIIIDPWIITPTSLLSDHAAYDIAYDDFGNVFVSGGLTTSPYYLAKYSLLGKHIWTFTNPLDWSSGCYAYSKFCILPNTGTVFMGEPLNVSGPRVMKINKDGLSVAVSPNLPPNNEIWVMFYNRCNGKLIAFGGGTETSDNTHIILDTNLSSGTSSNFNTCEEIDNDIASAVIDYNGDFYSLISTGVCSIHNNHLMKSLISKNYQPPLGFDIDTGYDFYECYNNGIPGFGGECELGATVRANALALNSDYLFSYDGVELIAWNKSNGSRLGSVATDPSYTGGQNRTHEGITVDECNNIYVGGSRKVHVYKFDGQNFISSSPITVNIPDEVYDLKIDELTNTLYICGLGFVSTYQVTTNCTLEQLSVTKSVDNCSGKVTLNVNNGVPPYLFKWSNGETGSSVTLGTGTFSVTITDNSCIIRKNIETFKIDPKISLQINGNRNICNGVCSTITVSGADSYIWTPSAGLNTTIGSAVTVCPTVTTTYTITAHSNSGCSSTEDLVITVVGSQLNLNITPKPASICSGKSITLTAIGGDNDYIWSPTTGLNTSSGNIVTASPLNSTTYTVSGKDENGCKYSGKITVTVNPVPQLTISPLSKIICIGNSIILTANGADTYLWSPAVGLDVTTGGDVIANPIVTTTYTVIGTSNGCENTSRVIVNVNSLPSITVNPNSATICSGSSANLNVSGAETYIWTPTTGLNIINSVSVSASPKTTTIYEVVGTLSGCKDSAEVIINVNPSPVAGFTIEPEIVELSSPEVSFNDKSYGTPLPNKWQWFLEKKELSDIPNFKYEFSKTGKYKITLVVYNQYSCLDSVSNYVTVESNYSIYIPNAFAPENYINNNVFYVYGTEILEFNIKIFDRWGKMLFESNDIKNGWDGRFHGSILPQAVYTYRLSFKDNTDKRHTMYGKVTLLR